MEKKPSFLVALMGAAKKKGSPASSEEPADEEDSEDTGEIDTGAIHAAAVFRRAISKGDDEALVKALRDLMEYC